MLNLDLCSGNGYAQSAEILHVYGRGFSFGFDAYLAASMSMRNDDASSITLKKDAVLQNTFEEERDDSTKALQDADTGQSPHFGAAKVHTDAPSSIKAWLKSPGLSVVTTSSSALRQRKSSVDFACWFACMASWRERTRWTLPSS